MDTIPTIRNVLTTALDLHQNMLADKTLHQKLADSAEMIAAALARGNRLYLCGNGGSAADAQHIAAEFSGRFYKDRKPLPAEALHTNTSFLTAVANDYGYELVYERAIQAVGQPGDILIGISTSGNSKNVVRAQEEAKRRGMAVISFTGQSDSTMTTTCDVLLASPSIDTPRIQEGHILFGHILAQLVEANLFKDN